MVKKTILTKLYDHRYDLSFRIVNFLFICGNIPSAAAYGVLFHNSNVMPERAATMQTFLYCARLLTNGLLEQGNVATKLKLALHKFMVVIMNSSIVTVYPSAP